MDVGRGVEPDLQVHVRLDLIRGMTLADAATDTSAYLDTRPIGGETATTASSAVPRRGSAIATYSRRSCGVAATASIRKTVSRSTRRFLAYAVSRHRRVIDVAHRAEWTCFCRP